MALLRRPGGWLPALASLHLFTGMLSDLVLVYCWCSVPQRESDIYNLISPLADLLASISPTVTSSAKAEL